VTPLGRLGLVLACTIAWAQAPAGGAMQQIAFVNVGVVPMDAPRVLTNYTVLVEQGVITAIGPSGVVAVPDSAERVDGAGRFLAPGLIDMHVHVRASDLRAYLRHGVTAVRNMWGYEGLNALRARAALGEVASPSIYSASQGIDGPPAQWPETQIIEDPLEAPALVARLAESGWSFLKVYQNLRPDVYDAVAREARARNLRLVGHVGPRVGLERALAAGQASIEHLGGYDTALTLVGGTNAGTWARIDVARAPALAQSTRAAGVWNCPTLAIYAALAARDSPGDAAAIVENRRLLTGELHKAGARLLAGTDAGIGVVAPGASMHVELAELAASGLSNYDALRAATHGAAEFLDAQASIGSVAIGRRADLLLLDDNPLMSLATLARPRAIMLGGRWVTR
jgi:imidazolonepropionase-like amidohydrolase